MKKFESETLKLTGLTRKNKELAKNVMSSGKYKYVEIYTLKGHLRLLFRPSPFGDCMKLLII